VRELENTIERAVVLAQGKVITPQHLSFSSTGTAGRLIDVIQRVHQRVPLREMTDELERQAIEEALRQAGGNRSKAAEILGIYRRLLYTKMREFGMISEASPDEEDDGEGEEHSA
jgi:two-component system response regulator AtoC